jgi:hypothetical protein
MDYTSIDLSLAFGLFFCMLMLLEIGRRVGQRRLRRDPDAAHVGTAAIEGAVFGLFGLLVAFTFSGAAARFDTRRQLIVEETNAIGTAYLRIDLLPADRQTQLRDEFRQYVDARLSVYAKLPDLKAAYAENARAAKLQGQIWSHAVAGCEASTSSATGILLLPALNQMIDITTTRTMAAQMHPPKIIFTMLFSLSLAGALMAGCGMAGSKTRSWIHVLVFAAIVAVTVFVILDLEYPRMGLIRVDDFDQALVDLRQSMK